MLVLAVPFGVGLVLPLHWRALGVGFGRYPEPQKALEFLFPAQLSGKHGARFVTGDYALEKESV